MPAGPVSRLVFDKHSSGGRVLSAENLGALCREMGLELSPIDVKKAHIVLDANGDGSLTFDEFVAWWEHGLSIEALSEPGGVSPAAPATTADAADLSSLPVLDEERLLHTLERRCRARCVYTSNGPAMLVAVNPYEQLPIYGDDAVERYSDAARLRSLPPHIYGLASAAFTELQLERRSQMVLISGESGAGKTETAKAVLRMVSALSAMASGAGEGEAGRRSGQTIEQRLLRSSGLLEAFGNCRTVKNNNSSRFGKLVLLYPGPQGAISRVGIETYLLEKTRVVNHEPTERSFHILHQLLSGPTATQAHQLHLAGITHADFRYTRGTATARGMDDAAGFQRTIEALEAQGVSDQTISLLLRCLSGLLHLGNVHFTGGDTATLRDRTPLSVACAMLQCEESDVEAAVTSRRLRVGHEWVATQLTPSEATDTTDALAKALYARLFSWLVANINTSLSSTAPTPPPPPHPAGPPRLAGGAHLPRNGSPKAMPSAGPAATGQPYFGVLDIFGFEKLPSNSLEQLAINFANEKLQAHFNAAVFASALADYEREGIPLSGISPPDNTPVVDLFDARPHGIFHLLQEECSLGQGSDASLLSKLAAHHKSHPLFRIPRARARSAAPAPAAPAGPSGAAPAHGRRSLIGSSSQARIAASAPQPPLTIELPSSLYAPTTGLFSIAHTAATVTYRIDGFLQKNKDPLHEEVLLVMRESKSPLIRALFTHTPAPNGQASALCPGGAAGAPGGNSSRFRGVMSGFRQQLSDMLSLVSSADCSYVRCIKPNETESPTDFDPALVQAQLAASGVLEAVRVSRMGYAIRLPFQSFTAEFEVLLGLSSDPAAQRRAWAVEGDRQRAARLVAACGLAGERMAFGKTKVFLSTEVHHEMRTARTALQASFALKMQALGRGRLMRTRARARLREEEEAQRRQAEEEESQRLERERRGAAEAAAAEAAAAAQAAGEALAAEAAAAAAANRAAAAQDARLAASRRTAEALTNSTAPPKPDVPGSMQRNSSDGAHSAGGLAALVERASSTNQLVDKMRLAVARRKAQEERSGSGTSLSETSRELSREFSRGASPRAPHASVSPSALHTANSARSLSSPGGTSLGTSKPGGNWAGGPTSSGSHRAASVRPLARGNSLSGSGKFAMALGFEPPAANMFVRKGSGPAAPAPTRSFAEAAGTCAPAPALSPSALGSTPSHWSAALLRLRSTKFFGMTSSLSAQGIGTQRHSADSQSSPNPRSSVGGDSHRRSTTSSSMGSGWLSGGSLDGVEEIDAASPLSVGRSNVRATERAARRTGAGPQALLVAGVHEAWGDGTGGLPPSPVEVGSSSDEAETAPDVSQESPPLVRAGTAETLHTETLFTAEGGDTGASAVGPLVRASSGSRAWENGTLGTVSEQEYQGIIEYAAYLGMNAVADKQLLWIARDALHASVPEPWVEGLDMRGQLYYYNAATEETLRAHPMDEYYRLLYLEATGGADFSEGAGAWSPGRRDSMGGPLPSPRQWAHARWSAAAAADEEAGQDGWDDISAHVYDEQQRAPLPPELVARLLPPQDGEDEAEVGAVTMAPPPAPGGLPWSPFSRDWRSLRRAMYMPAWHPGLLHAYVRRVKLRAHLRYDFFLELPGHVLHLASAQKLLRSMTAYYCLSIEAGAILRDAASYLGKLRASSVGGTGWQLFDNGLSPRDSACEATLRRRQLMAVHFQKNIMGSHGPARLACVVPSGPWRDGYYGAEADGAADARGWRERSLVRRWLEDETDGLALLVNKPPIWSDELGAYTLEYNGRATLASVKNVQLVPHDDPANLIFQMGKVSDTRFNLDFKAPLSPVQAFAIALTVFDTKLAASAAPSTMRAAQRVKERVMAGVPSAIRASNRLSSRTASRRCSSGRESVDSCQSADGGSACHGSPDLLTSPGETSSPDSSTRMARKVGGARATAATNTRPSLILGSSSVSVSSRSSGLGSNQASSMALIPTEDEPGGAE